MRRYTSPSQASQVARDGFYLFADGGLVLRRAILWAGWGAITLLSGAYYCSLPPSPDQSIFDYIAWQGLHGVHWYAGSFDMTWPGSLLIHETGIRLFGVHRWTARLTDFLLLQPAILAMYGFLRSADLRWAPAAAAIAYPIIYVTSGGWIAGLRDIVAMHFLIAASAIVASSMDRRLALLFAGSAIGYAVLLRPTYLAFAPILFLVSVNQSLASIPETAGLKKLIGKAAWFAAGVVAFPVLFAFGGLMSGTLDDWFAQGVRFVLDVYPVTEHRHWLYMPSQLLLNIKVHLLWPSVAAAAGAFAWLATQRAGAHIVLLSGMAGTAILSFLVQGKGFGYHLGGLIPLFVLAALGGAELGLRAWRGSPSWSSVAVAGLATASVVVFAVGTARRIQNSFIPYTVRVLYSGIGTALDAPPMSRMQEAIRSETVAIIRAESGPDDRFFQWGWNYDVGFSSERLSASRYVNTPALSLINDRHPDTYRSWVRDFARELTQSNPKFILIDLHVLPAGTRAEALPIALPQNAPIALAVLVAHANEHYFVRGRWSDRLLLKRR